MIASGLVLGTAYTTVLLAEVLGDKTLFTMGSLAPRHRLPPLLVGASVAVALKMLAAVALGGLIGHLPPLVVSLVSAVTFLVLAFRLWRDVPERTPDATRRAAHATTARAPPRSRSVGSSSRSGATLARSPPPRSPPSSVTPGSSGSQPARPCSLRLLSDSPWVSG